MPLISLTTLTLQLINIGAIEGGIKYIGAAISEKIQLNDLNLTIDALGGYEGTKSLASYLHNMRFL